MGELYRIEHYNKGEEPKGAFDIVLVKGIGDSDTQLNCFKDTMKAFLENKNLTSKSKVWLDKLPEQLVKFVEQLDDEDFKNDEMVYQIEWMIDNLKRLRKWKWYSSNKTPSGFEVIVEGKFRSIFVPLLHMQGIPLHNIFIQREDDIFPISAFKDVMLYKKYNTTTFELTNR